MAMSCLACGQTASRELYLGIQECLSCQFAWADIKLSPEQWGELYGSSYFFGDEYVDYIGEEPALRKNFRRDLTFMRKYCPSGRLFEVGSAYGFFLDEARRHYEVRGVDIHKEGCRYAREKFALDAQAEDFLSMPIAAGSYDAVAMWDMLEHVPNPHEFLSKAAAILKKGGYVFFSTLDITSWLARLQGRSWRQIHPPTHVSYFSRRSLEIMLKRAGFSVASVKYYGDYRSWNNTWFNLLVLRAKNKRLYESLKQKGLLNGEYYLNTFDHVYMAAQKL
jgi:SAM-dependent methyltransferase